MANPIPSTTAVVIPVHNGLQFTRRCLAALRDRSDDSFDIVLVDDGSTDGTAAVIQELHPEVDVVRGNGDLWWSGGVNVGCRHAIERGADVLVLYNNDNVDCSPNVISRVARLCRTTGDCVSAVAVVEAPDGSRETLQAGGDLDWHDRGGRLRENGRPFEPMDRVDECEWLPGMCLALTAQTYLDLEGVDERRFPQYRGDIDLTLRARALGRRCLVVRDAWVVNDREQSGMRFDRRVTLREVLRGFVSLRSSYNLRETVAFTLRHCPPRLVPQSLALYYSRYLYGFLKSRHPSIVGVRHRLARVVGAVRTG
jgi:GT2 family glycosyltransferase